VVSDHRHDAAVCSAVAERRMVERPPGELMDLYLQTSRFASIDLEILGASMKPFACFDMGSSDIPENSWRAAPAKRLRTLLSLPLHIPCDPQVMATGCLASPPCNSAGVPPGIYGLWRRRWKAG